MVLFYKFNSTLVKTGTDLHTYETDLSQQPFRKTLGRKCFKMFSNKYKNYKTRKCAYKFYLTRCSLLFQ